MLMQSYLSSWANLLPYVLLIAILLVRPSGLLGRQGAPCLKALAKASARHCTYLVPVVAAFAILPGVYSNHLLLFNFIIFLTLAQGVNVIYGFTGYLPFGYVGFFGAGAYGFSLLVMHLHAPPLVGASAGAAAAVVLALLLDAAVPPVGGLFLDRQSRRRARRAAGRVQPESGRDHARVPTASASAGSSIRR